MEFFRSKRGAKFFDKDFPDLVKQLKSLNEKLDRSHEDNQRWLQGQLPERERLLKKAVTSMLNTIYELELAGHFEREFLLMVEDLVEYKYIPDECKGCGEAFTQKDLDGGRCISCGRMIT